MSKKFDWKKIDFKDKKYIFPAIVLVLVVIIGWFVFEAVREVNKGEEADTQTTDVTEIQSIPSGSGQELVNKSEAMDNAFRRAEEYTAVQGVYDPTLIASDTTIYTEKEIAYIDSLERVARANQANVTALNEEIRRGNANLSESRRGIGAYEQTYNGNSYNVQTPSSRVPDKTVVDEMILYQKLINGEEILTPEQEATRKEEQIRREERHRVMAELNHKETNTVEKVENMNTAAFNTLRPSDKSKQATSNTFKAMVDQTLTVEQGSRIRFVLLEDIRIGSNVVKSGTHIYGTVTALQEQRILADIHSILVGGSYQKVDLSVLDVDGQQGLYVPSSAFRDATKAVASQSVQGGQQLNMNPGSEGLVGMAAQAVQNAYQSVTQAISTNISKRKATIKYNTIVYLTNSNQ